MLFRSHEEQVTPELGPFEFQLSLSPESTQEDKFEAGNQPALEVEGTPSSQPEPSQRKPTPIAKQEDVLKENKPTQADTQPTQEVPESPHANEPSPLGKVSQLSQEVEAPKTEPLQEMHPVPQAADAPASTQEQAQIQDSLLFQENN